MFKGEKIKNKNLLIYSVIQYRDSNTALENFKRLKSNSIDHGLEIIKVKDDKLFLTCDSFKLLKFNIKSFKEGIIKNVYSILNNG